MYRFHPSIRWKEGYPKSDQIVGEIRKLWRRYRLEDHTKFNTKVTHVSKDSQGRWIVNDPSNGRFDGIIAAVGSCGAPKMPHLPGQEEFKGPMFHSSKLDGNDVKGKRVLIIGGGASAVEALEFVVNNGAAKIDVLSRSDKWIIPRNVLIDILLAFNVFGQETLLSWIPESLLRIFFYRDLKDLAPSNKGLFTDTPMVNSEIFKLIREGRASWLRGDIVEVQKDGILFNHRAQGVPKGGPGREKLVEGQVIIMATGFQRPSLNFLPDDVFEAPYQPPNWYIQVFPPGRPDISAINVCERFEYPRMRTHVLKLLNETADCKSIVYLRQQHWHGRKLPYRHLHSPPSHVPRRPPLPSPRALGQALDHDDAHAQIFRADRRFRLLYLLRADLLVCVRCGHQPFPMEVGALCLLRHRRQAAEKDR